MTVESDGYPTVTLDKLPRTTTERLLAVADRIEAEPTSWDQTLYVTPPDLYAPLSWVGRGHGDCGTSHCVAGWAVRLLPHDQLPENPENPDLQAWSEMGQLALGINWSLASWLFSWQVRDVQVMATFLRRLATVPEGRRSLSNPEVKAWVDLENRLGW